ncbi:hypothetical protein TI05_10790 [Achromatium sp. WMS3]|nr:hypothetical protein TI05_10790 [Achromatium sp. WMS3]
MNNYQELSIIQRTHDLIQWYIPILNRMPLDFKLTLGRRIMDGLYNLLEDLIRAKYTTNKQTKLQILQKLNIELEIMRHQTRLLQKFTLLNTKRYEYIAKAYNEIGTELGGWIKHILSQIGYVSHTF